MCGICGVVVPSGLGPEVSGLVRAMAGTLRHRGPDDEGFHVSPHAVLGSRRLSIVDPAGGAQPMASEDGGVQVVYNGEIYNHLDLRPELEAAGHRFTSEADTEIVVHSYEERGPACLESFNGIFALAVWDARRRRLLLARDPLGVKPLYYCRWREGLAFASEVKALLTLPGLTAAVDEEALDLYLAFRFVPSPRTLFRGISKLGPGERLILDADGRPRVERYVPEPPPAGDLRDERECAEALASALRSAVRRQMMADVPVGVLLSGGADSAALLAVAAASGGAPVTAYTVGFRDDPALDEVPDAARTAGLFGVQHRHVHVSDAEYPAGMVAAAYHLDEPVATPSVAPYDALCRLAGSGHKVVLSGQGADEPFGGYRRHLGERLAGGAAGPWLAGPLRLAAALQPRSESLERAARAFARRDPLERFAETLALFPEAERARLRGDGAAPARDALADLVARGARLDPFSRFLYVDARFGLPDDLLLYGDKISMAHSLEVRVPFLDLDLLRLIESIPAGRRVRGLRPKRLLRSALAGIVPATILGRRKRNFAPPAAGWLQEGTENEPGLGWLLSPASSVAQYCRRRELQRLVEEQRSGRRDRRRQIFALLALEVWHRVFVDGRARRT